MKIKKRNETPDKKWTLGNRIVTKKSSSINVRITAGFLSVITLFLTLPFRCAAENTAFEAETNLNSGSDSEQQKDKTENKVDSVTVSDDRKTIDISVTLSDSMAETYKGKKLYLFELYPYQTVENIGAFDPVDNKAIAGEKYSFSVSLDINSEQLYARYLCAVLEDSGDYTVLTDARYIENYEKLADRSFEYPEAASKKGLTFQYIADAQYLGTSHTVLNVPINKYYTDNTEYGAAFDYCGTIYYLDQEQLSILDNRIKTCTDAGIHVYLNILLTAPENSLPKSLECLYSADASPSVTYYAVNTAEKTSLKYFEAFMAFLAGRYTAPDGKNGFAGSYIIGYEINSNRYYNNMGEQDIESYTDAYVTLLRAADVAVRSVYSNARVYISLGCNFNQPAVNDKVGVNIRLDYTARDILDRIASKAGDIPWNIAFNPYASDYSLTEIWADENAKTDFDTPYITMSNIQVLCDYLKRSELLYHGQPRSIAITEFGISADPSDTAALDKQAAAFAYAYYKAAVLDGVESVIYCRQIDNRLENGVFFGLCTYGNKESEIYGERKPVYDVFRYIDTQRSLEFSEKYLSVLGVTEWSSLIYGFDVNTYIKRTIIEKAAVTEGSILQSCQPYSMFSFTDGTLNGFLPTENASSAGIRELSGSESKDAGSHLALYASLIPNGTDEYMGISRHFPTGLNISEMKYIALNIKTEAPVSAASVNVLFRIYSDRNGGGSDVYEGTAEISPGEWTKIYFDISQAADSYGTVDHMTVWVKDGDGNRANAEYSLLISELDAYKKDMSKLTRFVLVIVFIISAVLSGVCIFAVLKVLIIRRKKRKRMEMEEKAAEGIRKKELEMRRQNNFQHHINNEAFIDDEENISGQKSLKLRIENVRKAEKGKRSQK